MARSFKPSPLLNDLHRRSVPCMEQSLFNDGAGARYQQSVTQRRMDRVNVNAMQ